MCVYYFIFPRGSALLRGVYIVVDALRTRPLEFCEDKINVMPKEREKKGGEEERRRDRRMDQWNFTSRVFEIHSKYPIVGARTVKFFVFSSSFDSWQKRGWYICIGGGRRIN